MFLLAPHTVKLYVKDSVKPVFCKPRPVPFTLQQGVEEELNRLENVGIIQPVRSSSWATPIVPVPKNRGIRICGDFKVTIHPVLDVDKYPLPTADQPFASLFRRREI